MNKLEEIVESSSKEAIQEAFEEGEGKSESVHTETDNTDKEEFIKNFLKNPKEESLRIFAAALYDTSKESITNPMKRQYLIDVILAYIKK